MEKQEYKKLHRELWQWLADNPDKEKSDWPRWKRNGGDIERLDGDCFPCDYFNRCNLCEPNKKAHGDNDIFVNGYKSYPECLNGLFEQWDNCYLDYEKRSDLALQIKDLW